MAEKIEPLLSEIERQNPLWIKIKRHCEAQIALLRARNDSKLDSDQTATLRGQIKAYKNLAALDKPAPQTEANDIE